MRWQRLGGGLTTAVLLAVTVLLASGVLLAGASDEVGTWTVRGGVLAFAAGHALGVVRGTAIGHRTTGYRIVRNDGITPPRYLQAFVSSVFKICVVILAVAWYFPVLFALLPLVDPQRRHVWDVITRTRPVSV